MVIEQEIHETLDDLITVREAAELMGCTEATVYRNVRSGVWPFGVQFPTKRSRLWRISREGVLRYVRAIKAAEGLPEQPKVQ